MRATVFPRQNTASTDGSGSNGPSRLDADTRFLELLNIGNLSGLNGQAPTPAGLSIGLNVMRFGTWEDTCYDT